MAEKRCYTVKDLQEMLDVSRSTVYKLLRQNEFRWIQLEGGGYRISFIFLVVPIAGGESWTFFRSTLAENASD